IEASGHIVPRAKAGHMTAPSQCVKSTEKALASRAVPHMGARSAWAPIGNFGFGSKARSHKRWETSALRWQADVYEHTL
ncbi:hypothetical protein, partial [Bradyrhizobium sp. BRP20]|uniref:hypothetical protein n=1 Tax=Bradyrhizobium sp. BRP20 TaxID=2793822 RepID=UPI001CD71C98